MTKLAPEWVRTNDPVIRSPARYRWTTAPAFYFPIDVSICFAHKITNSDRTHMAGNVDLTKSKDGSNKDQTWI